MATEAEHRARLQAFTDAVIKLSEPDRKAIMEEWGHQNERAWATNLWWAANADMREKLWRRRFYWALAAAILFAGCIVSIIGAGHYRP